MRRNISTLIMRMVTCCCDGYSLVWRFKPEREWKELCACDVISASLLTVKAMILVS
jgi:hypothetical protein